MAGETAPEKAAAPHARLSRVRRRLSRAVTSLGSEPDNVMTVLKSALAAWVSWVLAYRVMAVNMPAYAPFSAVMMIQVTVYQSVAQSLRYVAAVSAGVALQAVLGFFIGPDLVTFALVAVLALAIARWPALGQQGTQVATAAFFAFSAYLAATTVADRLSELGQILATVLIGSVVGVGVNLAVLPPTRYRSAEYGVRRVADSLRAVLEGAADVLREGDLGSDRIGEWRSRAERVGPVVGQARSGLEVARESRHYNPRRLLPRNRQFHGFRGYEAVLDALERVSHQVASLVRALDHAEDGVGSSHREFLDRYADCADAFARITAVLAEVEESQLAEQCEGLRRLVELADKRLDALDRSSEQLEAPLVARRSPPYGVLLVEAHRLAEEFRYTADVLDGCLPEQTLRPRR